MWPVATRLDLAHVENITGSSTENQNLENFSLSLFLGFGASKMTQQGLNASLQFVL